MTTPLQRIRIGAISLFSVFLISVLGYRLMGYSWTESVWLVVITISTVGFSEKPSTTGVFQLFTVAVILLGVSSAAYTCGGFIQMMLEGEVAQVLGKRKMTKEIERLDRHVIICGFSRLGQDLANQLRHRGIPFVVIDIADERVVLANSREYLVVQGDATSETVLREVGIDRARALATALPSDADNVFITLTARNLHPDIQIIAKSERESSCRKLRQAGADKIVMPHRVGAQQMERMISRPTTADLFELFAEASHLEMELDEIEVPADSPLADKTLAESGIKDRFNVLVVGIKHEDGPLAFNPRSQDRFRQGDTLLVIGEVENINRLKKALHL
jgi:voltage-gated potassium channel